MRAGRLLMLATLLLPAACAGIAGLEDVPSGGDGGDLADSSVDGGDDSPASNDGGPGDSPGLDGARPSDSVAPDGTGDARSGDSGADAGSSCGNVAPPLPVGAGTGTIYYVSPSGNDSNTGTEAEPWLSLAKVTSTPFKPGDTVLLQGGQTFAGCPTFSGINVKSTAAAPFTLGSYGTGSTTLQANCTGTRVAAISIVGINGFVLRGATILGNAGGAQYGVWINNPGSGTVTDYVRVEDCDISGFYTTDASDYGAEVFVDGIPGSLDHVILLDNTLHGATGPTSPDDNGINGYGNGESITNAIYQGNTIYDIGGKAGTSSEVGNGIVVSGVDGGVVQYNTVYDSGGNATACGGPSGITVGGANDVNVQFNEVYGMGPAGTVPSGACGWLAYFVTNDVTSSTFQYDYAHDNFGSGFGAYVSGTWSGNTFRFNIGQNDGSEMSVSGYDAMTTDLAIYDNTFFSSGAPQSVFDVAVQGAGSTVGGTVANNIFYAGGDAQVVDMLSYNVASLAGMSFLGNDYYATGVFGITWTGSSYSSLSAWASAAGEEMQNGSLVGLSVDPRLTNPGAGGIAGGYEPSSLGAYRLQAGSPLIGKGIDLKKLSGIDMGPQDYFCDPIPNGTGTGYDVGADGEE
jgi:hypothetical protein